MSERRARWFSVAAVIGLCLAAIWASSALTEHDDTDPPGGRSGLVLSTDSRTGCQYLSRPFGSLTPRLDGGGKHVGCKP